MTKRMFILQAIAVALAFLALPFLLLFADACPTGTTAWEGNCASEQPPTVDKTSDVRPSDEKPPRSKQAEWETGSVHADLTARPSTTTAAEDYQDEKEQR